MLPSCRLLQGARRERLPRWQASPDRAERAWTEEIPLRHLRSARVRYVYPTFVFDPIFSADELPLEVISLLQDETLIKLGQNGYLCVFRRVFSYRFLLLFML